MKKSFCACVILSLVCTALAQNNNSKHSPAGEPPFHVLNTQATKVGHFNPKQMLRLALGLQPPHLAEEEQFLQDLMTPGSPEYRQFLTPQQWNERFAPTATEEQAVVDWAKSQGFTITQRYPNRLIVDVEAPAATIEKALNLTLNSYLFEGYTYFANDREPTLPSNLAGVIRSVGGLHNFPYNQPAHAHTKEPPGPVYVPGPVVGVGHKRHGDGDASQLPAALGGPSSNAAVPNITNNLYDPTDIYDSNAYNYAGLRNFGLCCNPFHVSGGAPPESSIALATFGNLHLNGTDFTDVLGFHNQYPYLAYNVTTVPIDGGPGTCTVGPNQGCGNDSEATMDTEWSTATANSFGSYLDTAQVWVYQSSGSAEDMYNAMLNDGHARTFSTSWSNTEIYGISGSDMDTRHNIFNNMVGTGWTLMTASGDRGSTDDCSHVSVSYPASDPDVIGVGGTNLSLFSNGNFNSEKAWSGGTYAKACSRDNNGGSGGGCSTHFSAPSFQTGSSQTCGSSSRAVPDIALDAVGGQNYYWNGSLGFGGGTSISSPMLAGFFAQAESYLLYIGSIIGDTCTQNGNVPCAPVGNGNYYLYYFGLNPTYAQHYPFYDITSGCNSNDITQGVTPNLTSYCAGTGFDNVTGWGTANMLQLSWAINTYLAGDFAPPSVNFNGPLINHYYNTQQNLGWNITDVSANGFLPSGVAGYSNQWDADVGDNSSEATPGSGSSFYSGPQNPFGSSGSVTTSLEGCHTAHVRAWDNSGFSSDNTYGPVCFDDVPPVVNCASPDGKWHAADVSLSCTASDSISGLANTADASFNLVTSVAVGTETSSAFTNSYTVFDVAGNNTSRGPLGPNMVDKKPPSISITQPAATNYTHSSTLTLNYSVTDGGSGVGTVSPTMDGNSTVAGSGLSSGTSVYLLTSLALGSHTFKINTADNVSNPNSASVTFNIIVTAQSIITDVNQLYSSGAISNASVYSGLLQKLNDALAARNAGKCGTADNIYSAFINQVTGQVGKGITAQAASILIADAQYLIAHCP